MINEKLYIRSLKAEDLDAILELQETTILGLKDRSVLRKNTPEILLQSIADRNIALGAFCDQELAAIGIAVDPVPPETDLRANLQTHTVNKAMDLKLIIVKEGYRGNGLQRALTCILEKIAYARGFTHFCTSVSPNNPYSVNNTLAMGYEYDHQEELYDGLLRNVYVKELNVGEYNDRLIRAARKYEGTSLSEFSLDSSNYIAGDLSLCTTGDIAEFLNDAGESVYGLILFTPNTSVLLKKPDGVWVITELSGVSKYKFQRVLLNVRMNRPLHNQKDE